MPVSNLRVGAMIMSISVRVSCFRFWVVNDSIGIWGPNLRWRGMAVPISIGGSGLWSRVKTWYVRVRISVAFDRFDEH